MPDFAQTQLTASETARYSRHILLEEIGTEGQEALKRAKILIIGAGGLGSPAALYLAAAGVGEIGIADFDKVELHNLQRQIIHGTSDVNRPKAQSAKESLENINPHSKINIHSEGSTPENVIELFEYYDIVVDGTDNFSTRYLNNDAAVLTKTPLVYGSIFKFEGQISVFDSSNKGPCYRCLFPEPPEPGTVPNCGEAGVIGALCGLVGSTQALEAIKYITKAGENLTGSVLLIDTLNLSFRKLKLNANPDCPVCGHAPTIRSIESNLYEETCVANITDKKNYIMEEYPLEIDVQQTKELLEKNNTILLDVRESFERNICKIESAIHIPMNEIPNNLEKLPSDKHILVHCHHGGRSRNVMNYLHDNGFEKVSNVSGGIDAWALEIAPEMQRY
ncbi:molybdopterin-synthase adenylyltransferase MoeB [Puniceicoccaceae bacterium K14]|nr:molybdopterin-synthase adenylyltransferase MoeB [Puniceicoccaceae bacterium K14]